MRIRTKILAVLLVLSIVPLGILGALSVSSIDSLGDGALDSTENLSETSENVSTKLVTSLEERRIMAKARDTAKLAKAILEGAAPVSIDEINSSTSDVHMMLENQVVSIIEPGPEDLPKPLKAYYGYTVMTCNNLGHPDKQEQIGNVKIIAHPTVQTPLPFNVMGTDLENNTRQLIQGVMELSGRYDWTHTVTEERRRKYSAWSQFYFRTEDGLRRRFAIMATMWLDVYKRPVKNLEAQNQDILGSTKKDLNNSVSQYRNYAIIGFGAMVVIVFAVGILFARSIVNPIEKLRDAADRLSKGEMDVDVTVDTEDEIGELSDAFERMRNSLEKMMERIEEE